MSKHGLKSLFPMEDIAVMGLLELLPHLNKLRVSVIYILPKCVIIYVFYSFYNNMASFVTREKDGWILASYLAYVLILEHLCQVKLQETIEAALLFQPHVVVTVDSKGFSFRLLRQLRGNINHLLGVLVIL